MSKYAGTIVTLIITFIVTLTLNSLSAYFSSGNGNVIVSRVLPEGDSNIIVLSINNYSYKFIDGMTLEVPNDISSKNFHSDVAIQLSDTAPGKNQSNASVRINQIAPRQITTIVISGIKKDTQAPIRVLNASESGFRVQSGDELESPLRMAISVALLASLAQAVILSISTYYANDRLNKTKERLDELNKKLDEAGENSSDLRKELRETRAYSTKIRILLLGRIADYSKELEFWRNLIKEIVIIGGAKRGDCESLMALVRKTLKTYSTKDAEPDLEAIKIAAEWLRDEEKSFVRD
ncbi:hypothetical protein K8353_31810 [Burkholderia contaminans]|nr:hypothetical protein [Burkholderia contaminans]